MKKILLILLAIGLLFLGFVAYASRHASPAPAAEATPAPAAEDGDLTNPAVAPADTPAPEAESAAPALRYVDLEKLHALHAPDEVYATVGEREITWEEYYEWLGYTVLSAESYMESMQNYGMTMTWDQDYAEGMNFADYVLTGLHENLRVYTGVAMFAAANGAEVSEEEIEADIEQEKQTLLGENADDQAWAELLVQHFMTEKLYRSQVKASLEIRKSLAALYGENGENLSADELQHYLEDSGYLRCNHILFLTKNMETNEALDEETVAAKKAQAEKLAAELQAIEDREELLARFSELKQELDEDTGKVYNPDGYIFTPGTMVAVFENTTRALSIYEVSDPVLSEYGYHVIIRLPVDADTKLDDGSTIGAAAANELFAAKLDETVDSLSFELAPGMEEIHLTDFLEEPAER